MHHHQPYLKTWLRRTRRELSISGRLSELALKLSRREGGSPAQWSTELRSILEGTVHPSLDLVTLIDTLIAEPTRSGRERPVATGTLF